MLALRTYFLKDFPREQHNEQEAALLSCACSFCRLEPSIIFPPILICQFLPVRILFPSKTCVHKHVQEIGRNFVILALSWQNDGQWSISNDILHRFLPTWTCLRVSEAFQWLQLELQYHKSGDIVNVTFKKSFPKLLYPFIVPHEWKFMEISINKQS